MLTDSRRNGQERHACYANIDSAHFSAHRNLLLENHRTTTSRGVSAPKRPETGRTRPVRKWATLVAAALFDYYSNWRYFISARIKSSGGTSGFFFFSDAVCRHLPVQCIDTPQISTRINKRRAPRGVQCPRGFQNTRPFFVSSSRLLFC